MNDILPVHYAMSEAAIIVAGAYSVIKAWPVNRWFAIGLAAMAVAAVIAVIRIVFGMSGFIITLHEFLSRLGALFGLGCICGAMMMRGQILPPILGLATASLAFFVPAFATPLFGAFIFGGAFLAYRAAANRRILAAGSFAFLLTSVIFSAPLRADYPGFGWHVFHIFVAIWFVLVARYVPMNPRLSSQK